jgi:hypothetical protein
MPAHVAEGRGHEARHVNWLGLSGETDWNLMPHIVQGDFTFVTNNARDFRKLYAAEPVHAGLVIIVPQVAPDKQRELFDALFDDFQPDEFLINEVIEIDIEDGTVVVTRYELPGPGVEQPSAFQSAWLSRGDGLRTDSLQLYELSIRDLVDADFSLTSKRCPVPERIGDDRQTGGLPPVERSTQRDVSPAGSQSPIGKLVERPRT